MSRVNKQKEKFFYNKIQSGFYTVSEDGLIRNPYGKTLGTVNSKGYITIGALNNEGKLLIMQAHRVVWMALKGEIPEGFVPNHKDGNKQNNAISNLELVSDAGNSKHAVDTGLTTYDHLKGNNYQALRKVKGNRFTKSILQLGLVVPSG
jgi:hypothetical protein